MADESDHHIGMRSNTDSALPASPEPPLTPQRLPNEVLTSSVLLHADFQTTSAALFVSKALSRAAKRKLCRTIELVPPDTTRAAKREWALRVERPCHTMDELRGKDGLWALLDDCEIIYIQPHSRHHVDKVSRYNLGSQYPERRIPVVRFTVASATRDREHCCSDPWRCPMVQDLGPAALVAATHVHKTVAGTHGDNERQSARDETPDGLQSLPSTHSLINQVGLHRLTELRVAVSSPDAAMKQNWLSIAADNHRILRLDLIFLLVPSRSRQPLQMFARRIAAALLANQSLRINLINVGALDALSPGGNPEGRVAPELTGYFASRVERHLETFTSSPDPSQRTWTPAEVRAAKERVRCVSLVEYERQGGMYAIVENIGPMRRQRV